MVTARSCAPVRFEQLFAVHALVDQDGRALGEHRAPPGLPGLAPTELKTCPYAGGRHRHAHPMNVSALRQTRDEWEDIIGGLAYLNASFRDVHGTTPRTLWWSLLAGAVIPPYLVHRAAGGWRGQPFLAAAFKAVLGLKVLAERVVLDAVLHERSIDEPLEALAFIEAVEPSGLLVGPEQVCAATPAMIAQTIRTLVAGDAKADTSRTAAALAPAEDFHRFATAARDAYGTLLVFATLGARMQGDAVRCESAAPSPLASAEQNLSLTLGLRRIAWRLARLDEASCRRALERLAPARADTRPADLADLVQTTQRALQADERRLNEALGREAPAERTIELDGYCGIGVR